MHLHIDILLGNIERSEHGDLDRIVAGKLEFGLWQDGHVECEFLTLCLLYTSSPIARAMDKAALEVGVDFIGGFSALVHKGASAADHKLMDSIPEALATTERVCSSVNVGSTRAGINMDAVLKMAGIIKKSAELTADRQCIGAGKLVVFCNAVEDLSLIHI